MQCGGSRLAEFPVACAQDDRQALLRESAKEFEANTYIAACDKRDS
jgi:hypothetical protein